VHPKAITSSADRQLLERSGRCRIWVVPEGRYRIRYEVESPSGKWTFGTLFMALGKFDRVSRKGAA
jgi:hypothetical protein